MNIKKSLNKLFANKHIRLISEVIVLSSSGYLMLKKATGFSISEWLLANAFHQPLVSAYVYVSAVLLISALIIKVLVLYLDYFPLINHSFVEPDEISDCLVRMNSEICDHLEKCSDNEPANIKTIYEQHGYKINLALIVDSMSEHIRKSIGAIKIKKKDLFVSLYLYNESQSTLEYLLHFDPKRDLVESKIIDLASKKFEKYESVKCIKSTNATAYVLNAKLDYAKGASKRHKSIRHYLGCKLYSGTRLFGFLNIEFHNGQVFNDGEEMQDFMEEHVYPFKLLLEYQFLKREFFYSLRDFELNWRVA